MVTTFERPTRHAEYNKLLRSFIGQINKKRLAKMLRRSQFTVGG